MLWNPKEAFLRLGAGNYWNTLGELALPIINKEKDRLDLRLNHLGTFGKSNTRSAGQTWHTTIISQTTICIWMQVYRIGSLTIMVTISTE